MRTSAYLLSSLVVALSACSSPSAETATTTTDQKLVDQASCTLVYAEAPTGTFDEIAAALDPSSVTGANVTIAGALHAEKVDGGEYDRLEFPPSVSIFSDDAHRGALVANLWGSSRPSATALQQAGAKATDAIYRALTVPEQRTRTSSGFALSKKTANGRLKCITSETNGVRGDVSCSFDKLHVASVQDFVSGGSAQCPF